MKKNIISRAIFAFSCMGGFLYTSVAFAFPAVDFKGQTAIAERYTALTEKYESSYQTPGFSKTKKLTLTENRIGQAFKLLSTARTNLAKKRYEKQIVSYSRILDKEIARIKKSSGAPVSVVPPVPSLEIPAFSADSPTWDSATPADVLFYSDQFEGGNTSNGNVFRQTGFSAARCNVPFNTLLQLRYGDSGIIVKANDRPNCTKYPNIVDLTSTAFSKLASLSKGRIVGSVLPLGAVPNEVVKEYLARDFFSTVGIKLDENLPSWYLPNETLKISGNVTNKETETLIYVVTPSEKKISYGMDNLQNGRFEYLIPLTEVGTYDFVVASGRSFSGVRAMSIEVLNPSALANKQFFLSAPSASVSGFTTERREAGDLTAMNTVQIQGLPDNIFRSITLKTSKSEVSRSSMGTLAFLPDELQGFTSGQEALVTVTGRTSSTSFSHDTLSASARFFAENMILAPLYKHEKEIEYSKTINGDWMSFKILEEPTKKIAGTVYIITPSGNVDKVQLSGNSHDTRGNLASSKGASFSYEMKEDGEYLVEINFETGFAAVIEPVSHGKVLSILPNAYDFASRDVEKNTSTSASEILNSINSIRKQSGLAAVTFDDTLTQIAEYKAQDMADHNYVGHPDSRGVFIRDTAKRAGINIPGSMGENVAGGTVSAAFLQAGLSLSGAHRANMLGAWKKVGIGVVVKNGKVFVAQIFGE